MLLDNDLLDILAFGGRNSDHVNAFGQILDVNFITTLGCVNHFTQKAADLNFEALAALYDELPVVWVRINIDLQTVDIRNANFGVSVKIVGRGAAASVGIDDFNGVVAAFRGVISGVGGSLDDAAVEIPLVAAAVIGYQSVAIGRNYRFRQGVDCHIARCRSGRTSAAVACVDRIRSACLNRNALRGGAIAPEILW